MAETLLVDSIKSADFTPHERPNSCQSTCIRDSNKKRWMRIRNLLNFARIKITQSDPTLASVNNRERKRSTFKREHHSDNLQTLTSTIERINRPNEWIDAFDRVINDENGRLQFTKFLQSEYSEENILFWWAVQQLQMMNLNRAQMEKTVQEIYQTFIAPDSPLAINIDHETRAEIISRVSQPSPSGFTSAIYDRAQAHVYRLMEKDCFSRFVHTDAYKQLCMDLRTPSTVVRHHQHKISSSQ